MIRVTKVLYCLVLWLGLMRYFSKYFPIWTDLWYEVFTGYKTVKGKPIKCTKCKGIEFDQKTVSRMDWCVLEYEEVCKNCKKVNAHWAYGNYTL